MKFWGIDFTNEDVASAAQRLTDLATQNEAVPIRLINAYSIASADTNRVYRDTLRSPGINYADGTPVAAALTAIARQQGGTKHQRVRGPSLFEETLQKTETSELTHLFFGGNASTAEHLEAEIRCRHPSLNIAACVAPPVAEAPRLVQLATQAHQQFGGDIIWLGLGTPKQDIVARDLARTVQRPCVGVGAAFDFLAGTQRTAPRIMQTSGVEWLYRLATEPKRLWKRYTFGSARFLRIAWVELRRDAT